MERVSEVEEALERHLLLLSPPTSQLTPPLSLAPVIFWLELILLGKTENTFLVWSGPSTSQKYFPATWVSLGQEIED